MPRRDHCGGQLVGYPDLAFDARCGRLVDQPFHGQMLGPEVTRNAPGGKDEQSRPQHFDAGRDGRDGRYHRLEHPSVSIGVGQSDMYLRAACLSFPPPHTTLDTERSCCRRAGNDAIGRRDSHRVGGWKVR